jgi:hypothetical protein
VRHFINVEPDPDWVTRPDVLTGLQVLGKRGLAFDYVGILPRHLEHLPVQAQCVYIDCPLETSPTAGKPSSQYRPTAPRHEGCCHAVNEPPTHGFGFR